MVDITPWVFLLGLAAVIAVVLWKFGSLQRTVTDMDTHMKTVTDLALGSLKMTVDQTSADINKTRADELISRQTLLARMDGYEKAAMTPVESMGDVVKGFEENMGTTVAGIQQGMDTLVKGTQANLTAFSSQITDVRLQAEKIATLGQKYDEIEKYVKHTDSILARPSTKGKAGEELLGHIMGPLVEMGLVRADVPIGGGKVEYAALFNDDKILPIDSKVISTDDLATLRDEKTSPEDRSKLESKIRTAVRERMAVVQKYIDPDKTVRLAVLALPDSLMETANELIPEAIKRNVILTNYSAVPRLIQYFVRIHGLYAIKENITALVTRISKAQQEISALDDKFFQSSFENPVRKLGAGVNMVRRALSEITDALTIRREAPAVEPLESTSSEEEDERPIPVPV